MNYDEAISFLNTFTNYERQMGLMKTEKLDPKRVGLMLKNAGLDYSNIKIFHIAGTKGKGSTAFYLSRLLLYAGHKKVGLYTSPHLFKINERIQLNGRYIKDIELFRLIENYKSYIESIKNKFQPTYFDILTFLAMAYFIEKECDFIVLEVGLGGRMDSTNFCKPLVSIITSIGYDHTAILGKTLRKIAMEKGGIIKDNIPLVLARQEEEALKEVLKIAHKRKAKVYYFPECISYEIQKRDPGGIIFDATIKTGGNIHTFSSIRLKQIGDIFVENFLLATLSLLAVGKDLQKRILKKAGNEKISFRIEKRKNFVFDVAHNDSSLEILFKTVLDYFKSQKSHLYISILADKEIDRIARVIEKYAHSFERILVFDFPSTRKTGGEILFQYLKHLPHVKYIPSLNMVPPDHSALNVIAGSFQIMERALKWAGFHFPSAKL